MAKNQKRVAIVAGLRTPFQRQATGYKNLSALDLGAAVVTELLARTPVGHLVKEVVYGQVLPSIAAPNIAREIVLATGMRNDIEAYSVSRACATSYQSTINVTESILSGAIDCGIAGGADSTSDVPITVSKKLASALLEASKARSLPERLRAFSRLSAKDLLPVPPAIVEFSTGLSMGESAEKMAKENHVGREAQDKIAHESHVKASRAWKDGRLAGEVMTVYAPGAGGKLTPVTDDNNVRDGSELSAYAKLKPAFDKKHGTVTAANSSPLTDGASALVLMSEELAKAEGLKPLGFVKSWAFAALDPRGQLLMGPSYASPIALDRAGVAMKDLDLVDMHEAFAAQVVSNLQAFASDAWAKEHLGRDSAIGEIDPEKLNVTGGSISIGHPFAATGGRQITQTLRELERRGGNLALVTACAAGGLGAAIVLERS